MTYNVFGGTLNVALSIYSHDVCLCQVDIQAMQWSSVVSC